MWHSHLNDMEIPETKLLFPKGLNWVQHWVSRIGLFVVPYRPSKTITNRAAHTFLARVQSPESSASFRLCLRFQFSFTVKQLVLSQSVPVLAPPLIYSATGQTGTPHCTKVWHKNLSDMWRFSFGDRRVAASPSSQKSPRHNCPSCVPEQEPYPAWFSWRVQKLSG